MATLNNGVTVADCTATRHGSMTVDRRHIGKPGVVVQRHTLKGTQPFYAIQYPNGEIDHADEDCLRRV